MEHGVAPVKAEHISGKTSAGPVTESRDGGRRNTEQWGSMAGLVDGVAGEGGENMLADPLAVPAQVRDLWQQQQQQGQTLNRQPVRCFANAMYQVR